MSSPRSTSVGVVMRGSGLGLGNDVTCGAAGRDWLDPLATAGAGLGHLGSHEAEIEI